jgi:hypothetical protein
MNKLLAVAVIAIGFFPLTAAADNGNHFGFTQGGRQPTRRHAASAHRRWNSWACCRWRGLLLLPSQAAKRLNSDS